MYCYERMLSHECNRQEKTKMLHCLYGICLLTSALQRQHLAEVNLHKTSLSESGGAECIFLFLLTVLYLVFSWDIGNSRGSVLPHLSNGKSCGFWGKTVKCSYRTEINGTIFFLWPLRELTIIQFSQSTGPTLEQNVFLQIWVRIRWQKFTAWISPADIPTAVWSLTTFHCSHLPFQSCHL